MNAMSGMAPTVPEPPAKRLLCCQKAFVQIDAARPAATHHQKPSLPTHTVWQSTKPTTQIDQ